MANFHDAYRHKATQNVAYAVAGGASAQSAAFGSQTYAIRVCAVGLESATVDGVRINVGDNPTASATRPVLGDELGGICEVHTRTENSRARQQRVHRKRQRRRTHGLGISK